MVFKWNQHSVENSQLTIASFLDSRRKELQYLVCLKEREMEWHWTQTISLWFPIYTLVESECDGSSSAWVRLKHILLIRIIEQFNLIFHLFNCFGMKLLLIKLNRPQSQIPMWCKTFAIVKVGHVCSTILASICWPCWWIVGYVACRWWNNKVISLKIPTEENKAEKT